MSFVRFARLLGYLAVASILTAAVVRLNHATGQDWRPAILLALALAVLLFIAHAILGPRTYATPYAEGWSPLVDDDQAVRPEFSALATMAGEPGARVVALMQARGELCEDCAGLLGGPAPGHRRRCDDCEAEIVREAEAAEDYDARRAV